MSDNGDHERIDAVAWELSLDQADQAEPVGVARPMLYLVSVLDPGGIPQAVLASPPALKYLTDFLPERSPDPGVTAELVDEVLRVLHRHSLIDHDRAATYREVRVQQFVQRVSLAAQRESGLDRYAVVAGAAADALVAVWPRIEVDGLGQVLRANTMALDRAAGTALWDLETGVYRVLFRAADSLGETGQAAAAATAYTELAATAERRLGCDHPHTLAARSNMACWRGEAGDPAGAVTVFQELLADMTRVLGPDHPDTLGTRSNLLHWRGRAVIAEYQQLLADRLRVLGPDHPETLGARHNLAHLRGWGGDPAGAAAEYEVLLADRLRVLGPDHPDTLINRGNVARWRGEAGDSAGAVTVFEVLLADYLRVLGPDHPDTLGARGNLAIWRGKAGDPARAVTAFEELLADMVRVLGPDHPDTVATRHNLAAARRPV